jgi:hypothetical protein
MIKQGDEERTKEQKKFHIAQSSIAAIFDKIDQNKT